MAKNNKEMELKEVANKIRNTRGDIYFSVVGKVEDDLKDAADAGGHSDQQVDLICLGIGNVFLGLRSQEAVQEFVSGVDLNH